MRAKHRNVVISFADSSKAFLFNLPFLSSYVVLLVCFAFFQGRQPNMFFLSGSELPHNSLVSHWLQEALSQFQYQKIINSISSM